MGLPFITHNSIVVDAKLHTAIRKSNGFDLLNPVAPERRIIKGVPLPESQQRRKDTEASRETECHARLLNLIWKNNTSTTVDKNLFWDTKSRSSSSGEMIWVRACLNMDMPGNLIRRVLTAHLGILPSKLEVPIKHRCRHKGTDVMLELTEFVCLKLNGPGGDYTSNEVVALIVPEVDALSAQIALGAPFMKDNRVEMDLVCGRVWITDSDVVLVHAEARNAEPPKVENKLPRLSHEKVKGPSKVAAVRKHIEVLTVEQALVERGDQIKTDFPRLFEELPHGDVAAGRIHASSSPHVSPVFLIPKVNPLVFPRWVNNYRILNSNTVMDSYPLPRIDGILADCGCGKVFSKMDMTNSFFQTRVHPDDIHLMAVSTPFGLFEWLIMPMGLRNAPSIHQRRVALALRDLLGKFCHIYIDNIIMWLNDIEEHNRHLCLVMTALQEAWLFMNPDKCEIFKLSVDFVGHHISAAGIEANSGKVDKILNWPVPKSVQDMRVFLGLMRYISSYLPQLAEHTQILTPLTKKEFKSSFPAWTDDLNYVFEAIKKLVVSRECLTVIDQDEPGDNKIFVTTDTIRHHEQRECFFWFLRFPSEDGTLAAGDASYRAVGKWC